jgi:hypothetical protein
MMMMMIIIIIIIINLTANGLPPGGSGFIMHVHKYENKDLINLSRKGYMRSMQ